jgi:hypothetical protein
MRVAVAIARPVQPGGGATVPFELADWTATAMAAEAGTSSRSRKR